jgi:hypothetical protein
MIHGLPHHEFHGALILPWKFFCRAEGISFSQKEFPFYKRISFFLYLQTSVERGTDSHIYHGSKNVLKKR